MIETHHALLLVQSAVGIAVFFQTVEMLLLRSAWADDGVWGWNNLSIEFPKFFSAFYRERNFFALLSAQLASAVLLLFSRDFSLAAVPLFISSLICYRWRGTFNGGSDYVTIQILLTLSLVGFFPSFKDIETYAIFYLAFQLVFSYFIAGVSKIRQSVWRNGSGITLLLTESNYDVPTRMQILVKNKTVAKIISWSTLFFECTFPLSLLSPKIAFLYLAAGLIFHLLNFWFLGLNRFVFAWLALYPAYYAVTGLPIWESLFQ